MKRCIGQDNCAALGHYSRRLSSLATRAICSHLHNKLNVASVVGGDLPSLSLYPYTFPAFLFCSFLGQFIQRFFCSSQRVCLAVRGCVFMRSTKAINIVIIATFPAVAAFARRFTIRRHFALHCPTDSFCSAPAPPAPPSLLRCLIQPPRCFPSRNFASWLILHDY